MEDLVLSYSQLSLLSRCPQRYYRRYVLREPDIAGTPLLIGRAFHTAMEANFRHKIAHKIDLEPKAVVDIYRDAFDAEAAKPMFQDLDSLTEDQIDWQGQSLKEVRKIGEKVTVRYHKQHAPFVQPMCVEERFEEYIAPHVKLVGHIDLITTQGTVIDFKTVNYAWSEDRVEMDLQPTAYAVLLQQPINFDYHFITRGGKGGPGISIRRTTRTSKDIEFFQRTFAPQMVRLIRDESWFRMPGQQCFGCAHRKGCGYRI